MTKPKVSRKALYLCGTVLILALGCSPLQAKPRHLPNKKWLAGEAVILTMAAVQGYKANEVKQGGTYIFGNNTSTGKIVAFELFANVGAFTTEHAAAWYFSHDDTKPWRTLGYTAVPAEDAAIGLWIETHTNWGHRAGPYP